MKHNTFCYAVGGIFIAMQLASCGSSNKGPQTPPPTAVSVYTVQTGDATYYDVYPATITALNQVDIKPQVSGNITGIFFKDGDHVKKGQKLYSIDQQQYQGVYQQAVANLNVSKANLAKAQQDANRYQTLAEKDAIAKQTLDHALADLEAAKRQVDASAANVSSVKTNLQYSTIYAPFDGTIGISSVKVGTAVYPQTLLNTVSTDDPIAADVALEQSLIPRFNNYLQKGLGNNDSTFTVTLPDGTIYPFPGHIYLLDRAVDPQTGTIKARIVFPNPQEMLKVGVTCNVRVQNKSGDSTLLIPNKAIVEQLGENFVYVAQNNNKQAFQRKVLLGTRIGDKIVVKTGLQQGEQIIVDGVQKLRDSSAIQVGPPKPPKTAAGK
jgi:RND family efflux transporter MFP subunit